MITTICVSLFLCFLEGLLSLDNALVLAVLVRPLPVDQRKKALVYGIAGAFAFRAISLFFITEIMASSWVKVAGGAYLLILCLKFFREQNEESDQSYNARSFWRTVIAVELMDIAFSVDSILAAVGVSQDYTVVLVGGILGIIMMRFASGVFSRLIDKFPQLEVSAHLLIGLIGLKLMLQTTGADFHNTYSPYFWSFWLLFCMSLAFGFLKEKV